MVHQHRLLGKQEAAFCVQRQDIRGAHLTQRGGAPTGEPSQDSRAPRLHDTVGLVRHNMSRQHAAALSEKLASVRRAEQHELGVTGSWLV